MPLIFLLIFLLFPINVQANCYTKVNSYQEAQRIAQEQNLTLNGYSYGIASYDGNGNLPIDEKVEMCSYSVQESLFNTIDFTNTYEHDITGKNVVVAILDGGCDITHADLRRSIIGGCNVTPNSSSADITDNTGHGTFVAGIIAAADDGQGIMGIAPDAKLYIVKINRNNDKYFYYSDIVRGIYKCIELGNIDIINMSFGGFCESYPVREALIEAKKHGIVIVTAAGNYGTSIPSYPAAYQIGLSVGSCNIHKQLSRFSNRGINYNILAPGEMIFSTLPGNNYDFEIGTSISAPIVSGVAALVISKYNIHHNADLVTNIILNSADNKVLNVQNIFGLPKINIPQVPKYSIVENPDTYQKEIVIKSQKKNDVYYTLDDTTPTVYSDKIDGSLLFDKKGTYYINLVNVPKNSRVYSNVKRIKIKVNRKVYSTDYLESLKISYKNGSIILKSKKYRRKLDTKIIKWSVSNKNIVNISQSGKLNNFKKGTVVITANVGGFKKKIKLRKGADGHVKWTRIS